MKQAATLDSLFHLGGKSFSISSCNSLANFFGNI